MNKVSKNDNMKICHALLKYMQKENVNTLSVQNNTLKCKIIHFQIGKVKGPFIWKCFEKYDYRNKYRNRYRYSLGVIVSI